jgi:release factor glutamine methyltransferase
MFCIKNFFDAQVEVLVKQYDRREAATIAELLFEHVFHKPIHLLLLNKDNFEDKNSICVVESAINRLLNNEPVQYILGEAFFYDRKFVVTSDVLIPRGETEELVKLLLDDDFSRRNLSVIDICTGSVCIPVTLKLERDNLYVSGFDISEAAVKVAKANAANLHADVNFYVDDIFEIKIADKYDVIISNPPYVTESDKKLMRANVVDYEPSLALFVHDDNPLIYYRALLNVSCNMLNVGGRVYMEINENYGAEVVNLFQTCFKYVNIFQDINGKDRFVVAADMLNI